MKRIEDMSYIDTVRFLSELEEYTVCEKIDGSQLLVGKDNNGFYTSRETKSGLRVYNSLDYPVNSTTCYMIAAHEVLETIIAGHLKAGDQLEVEVIYGPQPNVISYLPDTSTIVLLRTITGDVDCVNLADLMSNYTYTSVSPHVFSTTGLDLHESTKTMFWNVQSLIFAPIDMQLISRLRSIPDHGKLRKVELLHQLKQVIIDNLVTGKSSLFGVDAIFGGIIEGVVLRDRHGKLLKVIDDEVFTKLKNKCWKWRDGITKKQYRPHSNASINSRLLERLGETLGNPELGTTQAKKCLALLGDSCDEILSVLIGIHTFDSLKEAWLRILDIALDGIVLELTAYTLAQPYKDAIHERTVLAFAEYNKHIHDMHDKVNFAACTGDIILVLVGKYLKEL